MKTMNEQYIRRGDRSMASLVGFSVHEIMILHPAETIDGTRVSMLQAYAQNLLRMTARSDALAALMKVPFAAWSDACKLKLVEHDPMALRHLYERVPQIVTQDMVDSVFERSGLIELIPEALRTQEHWFKHLASDGFISSNSIAKHLRSEAFWLKAMDCGANFRHFSNAILMEEQTQAIIDAMVDMPSAKIYFRNIRPDLLSDRVVGKLMLRDPKLEEIPAAMLHRGMRWLLDNGHPSLLDECQATGKDRGPRLLLQLHRQLVGRRDTHRYYQVVEELRDYPPESLVEHVTQEVDIELFRLLHGTETAIRMLGDRCARHKKTWIGEDFDL